MPVTGHRAPPAARRGAGHRAGRGHPWWELGPGRPLAAASAGTAARSAGATSTRWPASGARRPRPAVTATDDRLLTNARPRSPCGPASGSRTSDAFVPWVVTAEPKEQVLDARYLDAEDLRLLRMGITFRHRTGEGRPGRPLDPEAAGAERGADARPPRAGGATDRPDPPPAHLAALVKGLLRGAALVEVAHLQTHRTVVPIRDPGGAAARRCSATTSCRPSMASASACGSGRSRWRRRRARPTRS